MLLKFELASFYKFHKSEMDYSIAKIQTLTGHTEEKIEELTQKCKVIDQIVDGEISATSDIGLYLEVIQITHPQRVTFSEIIETEIGQMLLRKKNVIAESEIAHINDGALVAFPTRLDSEIAIADNMELNNDIRDFFTLFPYSTIKEAAGAIKRTNQEVRTAVEKLRNNGENIQFNNTPVIIEREQIAKEIIKLKIEEPALTNREISRKLGVSFSEVSASIKGMIKTWKIEKADNYDFYLHKTSNSIDMIEEEAWRIHESTNGTPSSRWMEIALMAIDKRITIHGLKAPEKVDLTHRDARTKTERDNIIDVAFQADILDVDVSKIQVTK